MSIHRCVLAAAAALCAATPASAGLIVTYTVDAGGKNGKPLDGLAAQAEFSIDDTELTIILTNSSSGAPSNANASDSLLVSLAFELLDGITIVSGDSAVIAEGSVGLGQWAGEGAGFNVGDEWMWSNDGGGDLLDSFARLISTSQGSGGGSTTSFNGEEDPNVSGPYGGIAAAPPVIDIPSSKYAVSNSIEFKLTLSATLSESQLASMALGSVVEFGSDYQYLSAPPSSPAPGTLWLLALGLAGGRRRRRRG